MISVIVPTYKSPEALDLCLKSAIGGQVNKNQLIVVVDGHFELNKEVLMKHKDAIDVLDLKHNQGLCKATNYGVYSATGEYILVVNDDNVFPKNWDVKLRQDYLDSSVLSPNHIEPKPSIFSQFHIKDLGRDPGTFDLEAFQNYAEVLSRYELTETGGTLPFFMKKVDYMRCGGWDENYPMGLTADWDFFYKCQLNGLKMLRTHSIHFYHFESLTTRKTPQMSRLRDDYQRQASYYATQKWNAAIMNDANNQKYLQQL